MFDEVDSPGDTIQVAVISDDGGHLGEAELDLARLVGMVARSPLAGKV